MDSLMEHAGALKRQLVHFGEAKQFAGDLVEAQIHYFDSPEPVSNPQYVSFLDYFLLQYPLQDGLTIVDHFVRENAALPQADKDILLGWKNVVEGLFEILRHEGDTLVFDNLLNDIVYRVRSNMGRAYFDKMLPGHYIRARIVPLGDIWMLSGAISMYPTASRVDALRAAAEAVQKQPYLIFRNPDKWEQAIELQKAEKPDFVAYFGSDLIVLPVGEFVERMEGYIQYRALITNVPVGGANGAEPFDPMQLLQLPLQHRQRVWGKDVETIGVTFDEREGMEYHPNFGVIAEAFADPAKLAQEPYRQAVSGYIQNPDVSIVPIRILAGRDPELATLAVQTVMSLPDFEWTRDGETLLRGYRPDYEKRVLPGTIPWSERLLEGLRSPLPPGVSASARKPGRNEPCSCGSGKKYKHCCG